MTLVAAFWLFDLGDKLFPQSVPQKTSNAEYAMPQQAAQKTTVEQPVAVYVEQSPVPEKSLALEKKIRTQQPTEPTSRLPELENREFRLDLRGTALLGNSHISKDAAMTLKMKPVLGSKLEAFSVYDAKFVLANTAIDMKNVRAEIFDKKLSLTVVSDSVGAFVIVASLDVPILADNNNRQDVTVKNQLFYLVNRDLPYKIDLSGTLSS